MQITTRGRYALKAIIYLAERYPDDEPVSIRKISDDEGISHEFLEQLMVRLRRAGVIQAVRGPSGGYRIAKPLESISIADVLEASGEELVMSPCTDSSCTVTVHCGTSERAKAENANEPCLARAVWEGASAKIKGYFGGLTLRDVVEGRVPVA